MVHFDTVAERANEGDSFKRTLERRGRRSWTQSSSHSPVASLCNDDPYRPSVYDLAPFATVNPRVVNAGAQQDA